MFKHKVTVTSRIPSAAAGSSASASASSSAAAAGSASTSLRREDRKRSNQDPQPEEAGSSKKATEPGANSSVKDEDLKSPQSPQPGPSGLQQQQSNAGLNAPDLQLDCLSSDSDDDATEEDVTVVKISRRRTKGSSRSSGSRRWHNSTTTINAPLGSIVEVDLTQESDHQDGDDDDEIRVDAIRPRGEGRNEGLIKLRQFATVPHLPPNVQSRGSTPSTTPAPPPNGVQDYWPGLEQAQAGPPPAYIEPHSHPCNGECSLFNQSQPHHHPPPDYRPRRLRQPYHHQIGCQDAHCRHTFAHHHRQPPVQVQQMQLPPGAAAVNMHPGMGTDQPLDCRATAAAAAVAAAAAAVASSSAPGSSAFSNVPSSSVAGPSSGSNETAEPPSNQRLISAVWRMQYHHSMRPRMHPRHERLWHSCQYQQELMRRHMGGQGATSSASNPTPAHHHNIPPEHHSIWNFPPAIPAPPAHSGGNCSR